MDHHFHTFCVHNLLLFKSYFQFLFLEVKGVYDLFIVLCCKTLNVLSNVHTCTGVFI